MLIRDIDDDAWVSFVGFASSHLRQALAEVIVKVAMAGSPLRLLTFEADP